jgi:hypothetical protein
LKKLREEGAILKNNYKEMYGKYFLQTDHPPPQFSGKSRYFFYRRRVGVVNNICVGTLYCE